MLRRLLLMTPLNTDLEPYVEPIGGGMQALRHPLLFQIPYTTAQNAMLNIKYEDKLVALRKAYAESDLKTAVQLHERPYQAQALRDFVATVPVNDKVYWKQIAAVWVNAVKPSNSRELRLELLRAPRPHRSEMMNEAELLIFNRLPDMVKVYRGALSHHDQGLSWTRSICIAYSFSTHDGLGGTVMRAMLPKQGVLAYFGTENEVVVDPNQLQDLQPIGQDEVRRLCDEEWQGR